MVLFIYITIYLRFLRDLALQTQFSTAGSSSSSLLVPAADPIAGNSFFPTGHFHVAKFLHLVQSFRSFPLFAPKRENIRFFVFNHLHTLFHSLQKGNGALSPLFSATSTLFCKNTPGLAERSQAFPLGTKPRPISTGFRSLFIMSFFRHIVISAFPSRNLIPRPIILWRRDTEPGVYSGCSGFRVSGSVLQP